LAFFSLFTMIDYSTYHNRSHPKHHHIRDYHYNMLHILYYRPYKVFFLVDMQDHLF